MNLDYKKGEINFADLNSSKDYEPSRAFYQSQLANMLTVTTLADHWAPSHISVNAVSLRTPTSERERGWETLWPAD